MHIKHDFQNITFTHLYLISVTISYLNDTRTT